MLLSGECQIGFLSQEGSVHVWVFLRRGDLGRQGAEGEWGNSEVTPERIE